jgi:hypothetical protein
MVAPRAARRPDVSDMNGFPASTVQRAPNVAMPLFREEEEVSQHCEICCMVAADRHRIPYPQTIP